MGGRADLRAAAGRPLHLLRPQDTPAVRATGPRHRARPSPRGPLVQELLRLRPAQALEGRFASRPQRRARPGRAPDAPTRHPRGVTGQEALHDATGLEPRARAGPRQPRLQRSSSQCTVGRGLHLLLDVVRRRLRRLRHRRVLPTAHRMEGRTHHDRVARGRCAQHVGVDEAAHEPRATDLPHRCGLASRAQRVVATPRQWR